jgi:hypothetical protein
MSKRKKGENKPKTPNNSEKPKSTKKCQTTQKRKVQRRDGTSLLLPLGAPWFGS